MKKVFLSLSIVIGIVAMGFGQQDELKSAGVNIEKKEYIAALDDLNKAKKKVTGLMTDQLSSVLPAKFGDLEIQENSYNSGGYGQGVSVNKTYVKPKPAVVEETKTDNGPAEPTGMIMPTSMDQASMQAQERITVEITTNMMMANEVMNAHAASENAMGGGKAIRVKGYRALLKSSKMGGGPVGGSPAANGLGESGQEEAHAIVGAAFIRVTASGMEEKGQAEKFLATIDFDKLKGIVGE